jgi:hypothetical protein
MIHDDPGNIFALEEMAKYFEHKKHDLPKAIDCVNRALYNTYVKTISERNVLAHRLKRLKSRMSSTNSE